MKKILFASILSAYSVFAAEPILKVGIISDTHIKRNITSCKNLEAALRLFKAHKVDMIVNTGDIAEVYQNQAYINYRNTVKKVYTAADKQPQEIFVFAWHDRVRREKEPQEKVYADIKKLLEIKHEMYETFKIKDYTFLLFPQQVNWKRYQNTVAEACRNNPGKPVFIIDHVPPYNTVYDSMTWGNKNCRKVLDKYPQVIHLSGHVHGTLTNQLNIWQGNFTAVNAGSLASWSGALVGNAPISMLTDTAMIMEIYTDKVVFRRFFSASQKEYQADARWIVPLPFDKKNAPYNFEHRKSNDTAPEFAKDAKLNIKVTSSNIKLTFPQATHKNGVFTYKIMLYLQKRSVLTLQFLQ